MIIGSDSMKKIVILLVLPVLMLLTGCERVSQGNYKEGTYMGHVTDTYGGSNQAIAVIHVSKSGQIDSVYLDTTYTKDNAVTTKKVLGNDYNMKANPAVQKEWYEQVDLMEKAVVDKQGIDFINWTDSEQSKTDSISGVTIKIDALYRALDSALKQAKK